MVKLELFRKGDVYIDYPFEDMKFRFEKASNKVFVHFYGKPEVEIDQGNAHFNEAIQAGNVITREEYFRDPEAPPENMSRKVRALPLSAIVAAHARVKPPGSYQELRQQEERLRTSAVGERALSAVAAGTSAVSAAATDRLREGLEAMCVDTGLTGLMVAWMDALLCGQGGAAPKTDLNYSQLVFHTLQDCLPLRDVISGCPVLDASGAGIPASVPLAMVRPDATLVLPVPDPARADWLRDCASKLGLANVIVVEQAPEDERGTPPFPEIISRDHPPLDDLIERTRHLLMPTGRWYVLRKRFDASETQALPRGARFVQAIPIPAPGLEAPRQILHLINDAGPVALPSRPPVADKATLIESATKPMLAEGGTDTATIPPAPNYFSELIIEREALDPRERDTGDYARFRISLEGFGSPAWCVDAPLDSVETIIAAAREVLAGRRERAEFVLRNRGWPLVLQRAGDELHIHWHIADGQFRSESELRLPVLHAERFVKRFANGLREKPGETVSARVLLVTPGEPGRVALIRPPMHPHTCTCLGDDAAAAKDAIRSAKPIDVLVDDSHFGVDTCRCAACGQHFLTLFCECIDWADSDDPQVYLAVPVSEDEARRLRAADIATDENVILGIIHGERRFLYHDMPKDRPHTLAWMSRPVFIPAHD